MNTLGGLTPNTLLGNDVWPGDEIFKRAPDGLDSCTVRQAAGFRQLEPQKDELLKQIVSGEIQPEFITPQDAEQFLKVRALFQRKES